MAILGNSGQEMDPAVINTATMNTLTPDSFSGATAADMMAMPADAMGGMLWVEWMPAEHARYGC